MKIRALFTFAVLIIFSAGTLFGQKVTWSPEKPQAAQKITVTYNPAGSKLEKAEKILVYAYTYKQDMTNTLSAEMKKSGNVWTAVLNTPKDDLGMILLFREGEVVDNNSKKGYVVNFYDKKGNLLPGTIAGNGFAYYSWGSYYMDLDPNPEYANELMNKDFTANPGIKINYVKYYVPIAAALDKNKSTDIMKEGAALLETKKVLEEDDYTTLVDLYRRSDDSVNAAKYEKIAIGKYPKGEVLQMKEYTRITSLPDVDTKIAAAHEFGIKFPKSDYLPGIHNAIIKNLMQAKDYGKLKNFMLHNKKVMMPYFFQDAAVKILKAGGNADIAYAIAKTGVEVNSENKKTDKKPDYLSDSDWKDSQDEMDGQMLYAEGRTLSELKKNNEAADILKKAAEKTKFKSSEINSAFAKALVDNGNYDKAFEMISNSISEGTSTLDMKDLLKTSYIKTKGSEEGYDSYVKGLEEKSNNKLADELKKEMIDENAPDFRLADLDGKEVALADLKGKVVVLDFWATWCGPCLASFPGMKRAVEMFSSDNDVQFLFVNTSERVADKKQNAIDFINKTKYPFHVVLDSESTVRVNYKVPGIPTKFVIDKNGHIKFKKVGYEGNDDQMVNEIAAMISLSR